MSMKNEFETEQKNFLSSSPNDIRENAVAEIACVYSSAFTWK